MSTLAIMVPLVVIVYIDGARWDPQDGANFGPIGEMFLLVPGAVTFATGALGGAIATRRRSPLG